MIHFTTANAEVAGAKWKTVQCTGCGCEFVYRLARAAKGSKSSIALFSEGEVAELAWHRAAALLLHRLRTECEPMPCPDCGIYQPDMVQLLKKRRGRVPHFIGVGALAAWMVPVTLAVLRDQWEPFRTMARMLYPPLGYVLAAGLCGIALGFFLRATCDPNWNASARAGNVPAGPNGPIRKSEFERTSEQIEISTVAG